MTENTQCPCGESWPDYVIACSTCGRVRGGAKRAWCAPALPPYTVDPERFPDIPPEHVRLLELLTIASGARKPEPTVAKLLSGATSQALDVPDLIETLLGLLTTKARKRYEALVEAQEAAA